MRPCLPLMLQYLSGPWSNEAYAVDGTERRRGALHAPVACELIAAPGRCSERWRFKAPFSLGVRTLARREIVDTVCREKGEDAARTVYERTLNGRTDEDVDELQRVAAIVNPAFVIPLVPAPAARLFEARWRVLFSTPWSRKEYISVWEARVLVQFVSIIGRRARGHAKRVLIL